MLEQLKKYLKETKRNEIQEDWKKIEQMGFKGPNAFEYIGFLEDKYRLLLPQYCHPKGVKIPKNMTPDFSGSFFS